jgi:hypothetical protein
MTQTSISVAMRIASLPISESERRQALAYVRAGETIADAIVAVLRFFSTQSTPALSHNH